MKRRLREAFDPVPDDIDLSALDLERIPVHIAVIMDGNGRWAEQRGKSRTFGHTAGIKGVRALINTANDMGVRYLTIYSFSTENWARPPGEVRTLMNLFASTMAAELDALHAEQVRVRMIGDLSTLPAKTRMTFEAAAERTKANTGMTLIIAVNYGSRREIILAAQAIARGALAGELDAAAIEALTPETFAGYLNTAGIPDPDLLIRTSGECRLSNFLLFQIAYSELYLTPVLWPDFDACELLRAVLAFQERKRRFGGV
ncbi:MAG: isoprenyl transferase [Coriobacteriales bacterium]|jgi:undecaprenyl diphosphate synthase|nr:isoprenyl transferase [Coriobacteriales bacterium]